MKINKKLAIIIGAAVIVIAALVWGYLYYQKGHGNNTTSAYQKTAEKAIKFINENIINGRGTASLTNVSEEGNILKISFKIGEQSYDSYVTKDEKFLFPEGYEMSKEVKQPEKTVGSFLVTEDKICSENGKPIIYFFGSASCPHCAWEHPIVEKVLKNFEGQISFHNNMDNNNDSEVFSKYSDGGIPTLVFGCKYYRRGSGEQVGEEKEVNDLTAILCKLTNSKAEACKSVADLVKEVK